MRDIKQQGEYGTSLGTRRRKEKNELYGFQKLGMQSSGPKLRRYDAVTDRRRRRVLGPKTAKVLDEGEIW